MWRFGELIVELKHVPKPPPHVALDINTGTSPLESMAR